MTMHRPAGWLALMMALFATPAAQCPAQLIIAHRGASHDAPENTLAAFELAWKQQADGIEGDFHLTRDGQIVCIHDADTQRTAGVKHVVAESSLAQLRALDVGSWKHPSFSGQQIPTLQEVLDTVPRGKKIFIEIKCGPEIIAPLQAILQQSDLADDQIVLIAFDSHVIAEAKRRMSRLKANWLTDFEHQPMPHGGHPTIAEILDTVRQSGADGVGCKADRSVIDQDFFSRLQGRGVELHCWTINELEDARYFQALGIQSITTDHPGRMIRQLQRDP